MIITKETLNHLQGIVAPGSDEWYLKEIEEEYGDPEEKGYQREQQGLYITHMLRAFADSDYLFLGLNLEGAPDQASAIDPFLIEEEEFLYPPRFHYQPHWLRLNPKVTDYYTYKLYHWIKNCKLEGIKIHCNSSHWFSITETKELEVESYKVLQKAFKKPVETPNYRPLVQQDLDILTSLYQQNQHNHTIDTIQLILHPVGNLSDYLKDSRPVPCYWTTDKTKLEFIEVSIIQWYLSKRILEWIAFGGQNLHQIGISNTRRTRRRAFLRPFYWDLWKHIKNLRREAIQVKNCTIYLQKLWKEYKGKQTVDI